MIPKIIHYCWFGEKIIPQEFSAYIDGWQRLMPEYKLFKWDETNSPMHLPYLKLAQKQQKWANMSNFVRLYALWEYGGIYLDTDVEVIKTFDKWLDRDEGVLGFESFDEKTNKYVVNNAVMLFPSHHPFIRKCLVYIQSNFDGQEAANLSSPKMTTTLLEQSGLTMYAEQVIEHVRLLSISHFYPYRYDENFSADFITEDTITIHHWAKSWNLTTNNRTYFSTLVQKLKKHLYRFTPSSFFIFRKYGLQGVVLSHQKTVLYGPFKGMRYAQSKSFGSSLMPKLLGSYEAILHPTIYDFLQTRYKRIINIGCGEGYYAVGLAIIFKDINVEAYDIHSQATELTNANAEINGVQNLVNIKNTSFDFNNQKKLFEERLLIVCDIEGGELNLFDTENIKNLLKSDLIIELHDFVDNKIKPHIVQIFSATHAIEIVRENNFLDLNEYPFLKKSSLEKAIEITNEHRPCLMEWAILRSLLYL